MHVDTPLERALEDLDGDREAMPLISLRKRKIAARAEALEALREARALANELEHGIRALDEAIAALEEEIVALGDRDDGEALEPVPAGAVDDFERVREEHARVAAGLRQARDRVRAAVATGPGPAIPAGSMGPGFATGATRRGAGRLVPGTEVGIRNARAAAESMLERDRRNNKADKAGERG